MDTRRIPTAVNERSVCVKSLEERGSAPHRKKVSVALVKNLHSTVSQLLDRYNYQCRRFFLLCAWFQICDYQLFDQVAFLQGPRTCGFAVFVAAAAVAAVELAIAAADDAELSGAFQSEPPFLPGLSGCIEPPA